MSNWHMWRESERNKAPVADKALEKACEYIAKQTSDCTLIINDGFSFPCTKDFRHCKNEIAKCWKIYFTALAREE